MNKVFILIGGNLGNRLQNLQTAVILIERIVGPIKKISSIYETAPWGVDGQPNYYNQVLEISSGLQAEQIMNLLLKIEEQMGRVRIEKYGSRIIDLDILFFNDAIICTDNLTIPHPRIQDRRFVLQPMAEIAGQFVHPLLKQTIQSLLLHTPDNGKVQIVILEPYQL
ncbi:MAG: 2-amino-4-hydroxy-6-hydroxymethyldihydropteridine diphosphokinase [Niabella sp.]